jgi:predicted PurR-regulated permease PerM
VPATDRAVKVAAAEVAAIAAPGVGRKLSIIELTTLVIAIVVAVGAARIAEPFLVPVVAGILLSYALRPLVTLLERGRVPRVVAAALVMSVLVGLLTAIGYTIRDDVTAAVAELPGAARKLRIAVTQSASEPGPMTHVKEAAKELDRAAAEASGSRPVAAPPPDRVVSQVQTFVEAQYAKAMTVVTEIVFALLLAFFLLASGDTFRRKVAKLAGDSLARRRVTVEVLNEIDAQVQRYLWTLLFANALIALATWGAMALLGLPNAGMWGAITGVLHVIPYAGAALATFGIGVAMFLHSGSIASALIAMAVVAVIATLIGIVYLSWLQGRASRMNAVAVFIGVLFFGWLWGGWGLLIGMPILAVLKSISDRVDSMRPVSELLGA